MVVPLEEFDWLELFSCRVETPNEREWDTRSTTGQETVIELVITTDSEVVTQVGEGGVGTWGRIGCSTQELQTMYTVFRIQVHMYLLATKAYKLAFARFPHFARNLLHAFAESSLHSYKSLEHRSVRVRVRVSHRCDCTHCLRSPSPPESR